MFSALLGEIDKYAYKLFNSALYMIKSAELAHITGISTPDQLHPTMQIFTGDLSHRIIARQNGECIFQNTRRVMNNWRDQGTFTVFQAGGFDLLTLNHVLGLTHSRVLGAMAMLGMTQIEDQEELQLVHAVASSPQIRLMVTMDTNEAIAGNKSRKEDKGSSLRPTLDWHTRATALALQSFPDPTYTRKVNLVDFVTVHGDKCCPQCTEGTCANHNNSTMAQRLQPNLVVVNAASHGTVQELSEYSTRGMLPHTQIAIVEEEELQIFDTILGEPVKTTSIVRRIRS